MAEYIERGGKFFPTFFSTEEKGDYRQGWNHCLRAIYQQDAADVVERKTAKWRYQVLTVPGGKGQTYAKWSCSKCHNKEKKRSPYCPSCGAQMEN